MEAEVNIKKKTKSVENAKGKQYKYANCVDMEKKFFYMFASTDEALYRIVPHT